VNDQPLQDAQLRDLAQQIGVRAAERVDPEQTAQAVLRRLREPRQAPTTRWRPLWLSAAATVALLLSGGLVWRNMRPAPSSATAGQGLDLNDLSAEQLRDVLNAVDQPLDVDATGSLETGIDDLTPGELRTLLRALEG
jgi:AcrR family transcriptional regulator